MQKGFFFILALTAVLVPTILLAATEPLVPCSGPDCQACHLVELIKNVLDWLIRVMASIIALVFAMGGFKMVTAGGDTGAVSGAREMMKNAVIGFLILLSAWLIVDTILKTFVAGAQPGFWAKIECVPPPPPVTPPPVTPGAPTTPTTGCSTQCAAIPQGITIKNGACSGSDPCTVSSEIASQLASLDGKLDGEGINWQVTEAWPPTRTHSNPCHIAGTCIDANFTGGTQPTATNVAAFINEASASGMRAVYEVKTQAQKDALVSGGVNANNIQVLGDWISAAHFSVYKGGG